MRDQIRRLFEEFIGTERFEKFVARGFEPRLRFWQEQELERFYLRHPDLRRDLADIQVILRICQVQPMQWMDICLRAPNPGDLCC